MELEAGCLGFMTWRTETAWGACQTGSASSGSSQKTRCEDAKEGACLRRGDNVPAFCSFRACHVHTQRERESMPCMLRWDKVSRPWPMAHGPTASISSLDELMASSHNKKPSWAVRDRAQSAKFYMETNLFDLLNYSGSPICSLSCKTKFLVLSSF